MGADFDFLAQQARTNPSPENFEQLWSATFRLLEWHFPARGQMPNVSPFVGMVNGMATVVGFTDPVRAGEFCKVQGISDPSGRAQLMAIPVPGFLNAVPIYLSNGIRAIQFNNGKDAWFSPFELMMQLHGYLKGKGVI